MNYEKNIFGIIIGLLISTVGVYAATKYLASDIKYNNTTVEEALNDLYNLNSIDYDTNDSKISNTSFNSKLEGLEVGKKYIIYCRIGISTAPKEIIGAKIIKPFIEFDNFATTDFSYKYIYVGVIETNSNIIDLGSKGIISAKLLND